MLLFASALEFMLNNIKMKNLIIDAAADRIFFIVIADTESYTSDYPNSRENFDKLVAFLFSFLNENKINIKEIDNIFVNQGPGKFSGIRASIAIAKALSIANKQDLYGFSSKDIMNKNYDKIIDLYKKGILIKNLIKPQY